MKLAIVEKKTFLAGLQCTLTSSCAIIHLFVFDLIRAKIPSLSTPNPGFSTRGPYISSDKKLNLTTSLPLRLRGRTMHSAPPSLPRGDSRSSPSRDWHICAPVSPPV